MFLRRYAAKLTYELELHGGERPLAEMPDAYAGLLGGALVGRLAVTHMAVRRGPGLLRRQLSARVGVRDAAAQAAARALRPGVVRAMPGRATLLRAIWREGQRLDADELLAQATGERIDFAVMLEEV